MAKNIPRRSGSAQAAQHRNGGPMRHRLQPRGGARNTQVDLLEDAFEDDLSELDNLHLACMSIS